MTNNNNEKEAMTDDAGVFLSRWSKKFKIPRFLCKRSKTFLLGV